ncbi:4-coumarate--CoA ligase family protein [Hamadaea sp. NPDC051192]|uniref:4-coumarate--CoA ligase family protein n=1 Tax=Hamadaea sp. NPDC051192 TaxID=3154940 RepID=UPI003439CAEB
MFRSPFPDVAVPDATIPQHVLGGAAARGDAPALIDGRTGQTVSYAHLAYQVERLSAGLAEAGLRPGDVLAIFSPNTLLYPVVFHAALAAGATVTTVNALATPTDLASQLHDSKARFLVTVSPFLDRVTASQTEIPVFVCDQAEGYRSVSELLASTAPAPVVDLDPATAVATLPYSSGTTGVAKGVMLTHRNIVANVEQAQVPISYAGYDRVIAILPFFHIYGLTVLMNMVLARGGALVILPRFDLAEFLGALAAHKVTRAMVAPPVVLALAKHPSVADYDLSALEVVFSGAAPLDGDLAAACAARLGCAVQQGYGMTELSPVTHAQPYGARQNKAGSIGPLLPNTEARVVDVATGADAGVGESGELLIRGPQVMLGYLGRPDETAATIDADGWLHTGDLGMVDADGDWYILDRVKELIKYKGYQVPPAELEAVLLNHPGIADAAVIAGHDADGEEIPHAFVVAAAGSSLTASDVIEYVSGRVAPYKKVRAVTFVDAIPKSASGKILRKDLRATL